MNRLPVSKVDLIFTDFIDWVELVVRLMFPWSIVARDPPRFPKTVPSFLTCVKFLALFGVG